MAKGKGKTAASTAPSMCLCNHPFNCDCGNRPERPSLGHKWDGETQTWGGKGHKQKGAGTAQSAAAATTTSANTTIHQWQRMPVQLVQEYCKANKRPNGKFKNVETKPRLFRYRLILPDSKKPDKDLFFTSANAVPSAEQAEQEVALLCLFDLTRSLPHEQRLPEPYRTTWLNITKVKAPAPAKGLPPPPPTSTAPPSRSTQSTSSTSLAMANKHRSTAESRDDALAKKKIRNDRIRHHDNRKLANKDHPIFMSSDIRSLIERVLRNETDIDFDALSLSSDLNNIDDIDDDVKAYVLHRLREVGFPQNQAVTAWNSLTDLEDEEQAYEKALQFLLVNVPEDTLPEQFNPKGRTLDVVSSSAPLPSHSSSSSSSSSSPPPEEGASLYGGSGSSVTEIFASFAPLPQTPPVDSNAAPIAEARDDEWEALSAIIFDKRLERIPSPHPQYSSLISIETNKSSISLHIFMDDNYPNSPPLPLLHGPNAAEYQAAFIGGLDTLLSGNGEPVIYDCYVVANDLLDLPPPSAAPAPSTPAPPRPSSQKHTNSQKPNPNPRKPFRPPRPRAASSRPSFWNTAPAAKSVPPATPFPPGSLKQARQNLPAHKARGEFLQLHDLSKQVLLVTGETGCGKTTQIPQFILETYPQSKIVVAQPRRLAATGVAMRVAAERGESSNGAVGYVVRGDTSVCTATRLLFCTTGVLLRQLQNDSALNCLTHIVIDEVHERNLDTDVLLAVLKEELKKNKKLKVVLMSATMDADRFAAYWGNDTPRMHIPGFTHPVQDFFLKDVLEVSGYVPPRPQKGASSSSPGGGGKKAQTGAFDEEDLVDVDADEDANTMPSSTVTLQDLVQRVDDVNTDYYMIAALVETLIRTKQHVGDDGSILVFLPGVMEISKCERAVLDATRSLASRTKVFQLHGGCKPADQKMVFNSYRDFTKVIIATNVAETSITIPDCVVVIDGCREKQSSFDPANRMPLLLEQFACQDSLRQRRGRAGRVRPGVCFKLITKKRFSSLPEHGAPEITRCALDSTILNLKFLGLDTRKFLNTMLDPPSPVSIATAVDALKLLGAVRNDEWEDLAPLGMILAQIPTAPCVSKMLVYGSLLGCRDAGLTVASGMSVGRSPFLKIILAWKRRPRRGEEEVEEEEDYEEVKKKRVLENREKLRKTVGHTDLGLLAAAYSKWSAAARGGEKRHVCEAYGLSEQGMREFEQLRNQFDGALSGAGFRASRSSNVNEDQWRVTRAMIVAALCPGGLVRVERSALKYSETKGGAVEKDGVARELKFFIKPASPVEGLAPGKLMRVFVHPSSAMFSTGNYNCPWLVFFSMAVTSKPFLRDITEATGYAMLMFGGVLEVRASEGVLVVAGTARFSAPPRIGVLVGGLREKLDELLMKKVEQPEIEIERLDEAGVMQITTRLLIGDGLG